MGSRISNRAEQTWTGRVIKPPKQTPAKKHSEEIPCTQIKACHSQDSWSNYQSTVRGELYLTNQGPCYKSCWISDSKGKSFNWKSKCTKMLLSNSRIKQLWIAQAAAHVIDWKIILNMFTIRNVWVYLRAKTIKVHNFYTYKIATKLCYSLQKHIWAIRYTKHNYSCESPELLPVKLFNATWNLNVYFL